jgi:hypothetical protein
MGGPETFENWAVAFKPLHLPCFGPEGLCNQGLSARGSGTLSENR